MEEENLQPEVETSISQSDMNLPVNKCKNLKFSVKFVACPGSVFPSKKRKCSCSKVQGGEVIFSVFL